MILPTAAVLMGALWAGAMWTVTALRVQDAAAVAARVAITQPEHAVADAAARVAGEGAQASVRREGSWIHVDVTGPGHGWLPEVSATASTWTGP